MVRNYQNNFNRNYNGNYSNRNYNNQFQQGRNYNRQQQNYNNQNMRQRTNYQQNQGQTYQSFGQTLNTIQEQPIEILQGTIFDVFGGIPQSFVGISGEAGSGKSQILMKLIADISLREHLLVILTEQSPQRWKSLFSKYLQTNSANPQNIRVIAKQYFDDNFLNSLRQIPERIIVIDSISGATTEQNARQVARKLRNLVEYNGKWIIGSLQIRNTGNIAGGEGVEHMIEVSFRINHFTLKPQHIWYRRKLEEFGYKIGDDVRLIKQEFNKITGVLQRNIVLYHITPDNPIPILKVLEYNQEEHQRFIEEERNNNNNGENQESNTNE